MILGMEIRDRVVDYVQKRIAKLRKDNPGTGHGRTHTLRTIMPGGRSSVTHSLSTSHQSVQASTRTSPAPGSTP